MSITLLFLYAQSNPWLVTKAFQMWEPTPRPISSLTNVYSTGILLTGGLTGSRAGGLDAPQLADNSDRLLTTFYLYKQGKIESILVTGTDAPALLNVGLGEANEAKRLLMDWGVPEEKIHLELQARNTRENALYTAAMLDRFNQQEHYLLITSAFHMKRAAACFEKVGIKVTPFAADFRGNTRNFPSKRLYIPETSAIGEFTLLWREWVGFLVYKLMGYC